MWREQDTGAANSCDDFVPMLVRCCRIADNNINCDPAKAASREGNS
jgi:hypothetical protein